MSYEGNNVEIIRMADLAFGGNSSLAGFSQIFTSPIVF